MKKKWIYKRRFKVIASICIVISIIMISNTLYDTVQKAHQCKSFYWKNFYTGQLKYEESVGYRNIISRYVEQLGDYLNVKSKLNINGEKTRSYKKNVVLKLYQKGGEKKDVLTYTIEDFLNMAEKQNSTVEDYKDHIQSNIKRNGDQLPVTLEKLSIYYDFLDEYYGYYDIDGKRYLGVGNSREEEDVNEEVSLEDVAKYVTFLVAYYEYCQESFKIPSNFKFILQNRKTKQVIKNIEDDILYEKKFADGTINIQDYFENTYNMKGYYISETRNYVDRGLGEGIVSPLLEEEFYGFMDYPSFYKDWNFGVAIDDTYSIKDGIYSGKIEFDTMINYSGIMIFNVIAATLLFLLGSIFLCFTCGHKEKEEGIHLKVIDRIYGEIVVIIVMIAIVVICGLISKVFPSHLVGYPPERLHNVSTLLIPIGILCGGIIFIFFYSFLRRVKARVFWKNTFIGMCIRKINKIYSLHEVKKKEIKKVLAVKGSQMILLLVFYCIISYYQQYYGVSPAGFFTTILFILAFILQVLSYVMEIKRVVLQDKVLCGVEKISNGEFGYQIQLEKEKKENAQLINYINLIGSSFSKAVEESIKDERMKTELITNVSHDLKTPLTSIINYVELLKREKVEDQKINSYIGVLDEKAQQLKRLTEDLLEVSKANSGNLVLNIEQLDFVELVYQVNGEFREKFQQRRLTLVEILPKEPVVIKADGARMWRVLENLYINIEKYAMESTRVYMQLNVKEGRAEFILKNISLEPLNISPDELMERFIRGDESRTTEGSGLGLSIAESLVKLQGGTFKIHLDGDLFRVTVEFPMVEGQ